MASAPLPGLRLDHDEHVTQAVAAAAASGGPLRTWLSCVAGDASRRTHGLKFLMRAIGFRANPKSITYAVVEGQPGPVGDQFAIRSIDAVPIPAALWRPAQLHFVRTVLLDIMEDFQVERAGLRLTEAMAGRSHAFRDNIEGVIQELLASSDVSFYVAGMNAHLTSRLALADKTLFKRYCEGLDTPPFVSEWASLKTEQREATLAAIASLRGGPAPVAIAAATPATLGNGGAP